MIFNSELKSKTISLQLNGYPDSHFVQYTYNDLKIDDLKRFVQKAFDRKFNDLRIFTQEGVEIFEEDLEYIKSNAHLYISDKQDFDQSSSFSIYQIIKQLGEGGFGKVLLGKHKITSQLAAIKIIETLKIGNAIDIDMVFREAELMKSLVHKNIVKIYNCYTLKNMQVVIVMEFLEGGELLEYVQEQGRLTEEEACFFFKQISEAIAYCHNQKLIHRDLKLENILIASKQDRLIKIADFGIAGMATNFNVDKLDVGSLSYMAPEILSGRARKLGPQIDIWALGIILYGLVCGYLPFTKANQSQTIKAIIQGDLNYPQQITLSNDVKNLIEKMLKTNDQERIRMLDILKHPWLLQHIDVHKLGQLKQNEDFSSSRRTLFKKENSRVTFGGILLHKQPTQKLTSSPTQSSLKSEHTHKQKINSSKSHFLNQNCFTQSPIKVGDQQIPQDEKLDDSNLEIIHLGQITSRKVITKDYSSILLKYRQNSNSHRILMNPFLKDLEKLQRKEMIQSLRKKPKEKTQILKTPSSNKEMKETMTNFTKRYEYFKTNISSRIKQRSKKQLQKSQTERVKSTTARESIIQKQINISPAERLKTISPMESIRPFETPTTRLKSVSPKNEVTRWMEKLKFLTPIVQYDLQHQFMLRKKNSEASFQCNFLQSFKNSQKFDF